MRYPNLFIAGAAKAGTTSLYHYLKQHPDIFMSPIKEPKYFSVTSNIFPHNGPGDIEVDNTVVKSKPDYLALFTGVKGQRCIGEASADYLYFHDKAFPEIKRTCPEAKIIIVLRNPIDRAYSAYAHMRRDGREPLSFEDALYAEEKRRIDNYEFIWSYTKTGFYFQQVCTCFNVFGEQNVRVYLYDQLLRNPRSMIRDIFQFLRVNTNVVPNTTDRYNVSRIYRSNHLHGILADHDHPVKRVLRPVLVTVLGSKRTGELVNYLASRNTMKMKNKTRKILRDLYEDDIRNLGKILKSDLTSWLNL